MVDDNFLSKINQKTLIMGVLNVTPDSFSDGGEFNSIEKAVERAIQIEKEGADIIDIGGESTRPGSEYVSVEEELNRLMPVIENLTDKISIPISIDTYKSKVAKKALDFGVSMVNDVTALRGDKKLVKLLVDYDVPVCLMHMKGTPKDMQKNPTYDNVLDEIYIFLKERVNFAMSHGVKKDNIIIDPGLGFGKRTGEGIEDNCHILNRLTELKKLNLPILIGASRKTFIGNVSAKNKVLPPSDRLEGSLAAASIAVYNGANIIRTHDVKETLRCIRIVDCIVKQN